MTCNVQQQKSKISLPWALAPLLKNPFYAIVHVVVNISLASAQCPRGSHNFKGETCFLMYGRSKTWQDARESCRSQSYRLAKITSDEMLQFVVNKLPSDNRYWIGGSVAYRWRWHSSKLIL